MKIRPCHPNDLAAVLYLRNVVQSEPMSLRQLRDSDTQNNENPHVTWARFVAEDETAGVIGYALTGHWNWLSPDHFSLYVTINEQFRGQGIGKQLLDTAQDWALSSGATGKFTAYMRSDDEPSFQWAVRQGFYLDLDRTESVLDLTGWDGAPFAGHIEKVQASGIRLAACDEIDADDLLRQLYEVESTTLVDVPGHEGHTTSWEEYRDDYRGWKNRKVIALAFDGDLVVGMSLLALPDVQGGGAYTGYTGVLRAYRGRGIAFALKLLTIAGAVANGAPRMRTNNDFENPSMLAVNTKLGYRLVAGPRRMKKQ